MFRAGIEITIRLKGPFLTQSTSPGQYGIDAVAARSADGVLLIPGSHVEGKLRQAWEELRGALGSAASDFVPGEDDIRSLLGDEPDSPALEPRSKKLLFSDFLCEKEARREAVRYRIEIDELRGAVKKGALMAVESPFASGEEAVFAGRVTFLASSKKMVEKTEKQVRCGLQWVGQMGAFGSIGFGRVVEVQVGRSVLREVKIEKNKWYGSSFDLAIKPDGPFCISKRPVTENNLFESLEVIPGNVILGVLARTLGRLLGGDGVSLDGIEDKGAFSDLIENFNKIRVLHAFPAGECNTRPVRPPLSLIKAGGLYDAALLDGPCLVNGQAPEFSIDWKESGDVRKRFGWPELSRELRIRTAIDPDIQRSEENKLFAYEMILPEGRCWLSRVDFSLVPDEVRPKVMDQLAALLKIGLVGMGKTKVTAETGIYEQGTIRDFMETDGTERMSGRDGLLIITLQTPALLLCPDGPGATLDETIGHKELFTAYKKAWEELSPGLELLRCFARQRLSGGKYQHRRFRKDREYYPWILTEEGSVFVFNVRDNGEYATKVTEWLARGLPIPKTVKDFYTIRDDGQWKTCPFIPQNGFGEIAVNLEIHKDLCPSQAEVTETAMLEDIWNE